MSEQPGSSQERHERTELPIERVNELAGRLADVTGDDTYTRVLGDRDITSY